MKNKLTYWYWRARGMFFAAKLHTKAKLAMWRYQFPHWFFSWHVDNEGDIVFSVAKRLHFVKYKEHTIVKYGKQDYEQARKWVVAKAD